MNIPDDLKIIKTVVVTHQYSWGFSEAIEDLNKEGTVIIDWSTIPNVATAYICKPKNIVI